MSDLKRAPLFVLDNDATSAKGLEHIVSNIETLAPVFNSISTTLGPLGRDKLIYNSASDYFISNDGATLLSSLRIVHPVATLLKTVSLAQDTTVGDGTTSVCLLTATLLDKLKPFVSKKMFIPLITDTLVEIEAFLIKALEHLSIKSTQLNRTLPEMAKDCVSTSLSSKIISKKSKFFADLVVEALNQTEKRLNNINYTKSIGGDVSESFLFKGIVFKKTFSYAGFERQPKLLENVSIALLEVELELKSERETAELRITSTDEYEKVVEAERKIFFDKIDALVDACKNKEKLGVVLSTMPIGDFATQYMSEKGIFCAGRLDKQVLNNLSEICEAKIMPKISKEEINMITSSLGKVKSFKEERFGSYRYNFVEGTKHNFSTLFLRGGNTKFLDEVQRSLNDAVKIASVVLKSNGRVVSGAGATEIALANSLREHFIEPEDEIESQKKLIYEAFADALEKIPEQLITNAGFDGIEIVGKLRKCLQENKNYGVNLNTGKPFDKLSTFEPIKSKENMIKVIVETACLILSIDETVKDRATHKMD